MSVLEAIDWGKAEDAACVRGAQLDELALQYSTAIEHLRLWCRERCMLNLAVANFVTRGYQILQWDGGPLLALTFEVRGELVRIGIEAPRNVDVDRKEVRDLILGQGRERRKRA